MDRNRPAAPSPRRAAPALRVLFIVPLALCGLHGLAGAARAQETGRITGRIVDEETARPLQLAQISVATLGTGVVSDVEGQFSLSDLPAGTYEIDVRLLGYATKTVTGVEVRPGAVTPLDISLPPRAVEIEELRVSVAEERGTTTALLDTRKQAPAVTDAIGREQISRSPDSDAAAAMTRMPGVSVVDNRFVFVRGLGERYGNTTLDGVIMPSPIPDRKAVPLDLVPAGFIESLSTSKSYLPDQPGDYAGGLVQIETRRVPGVDFFRVGLSTGFDSEATFVEGLDYAGGDLDFLGFDDGTRDLPDLIPSDRRVNATNFSPAELESIGEAFGRVWAGRPDEHPVNRSGEIAFSTDIPIGSRELGLFATGGWSESWSRRADYVERVFAASGLADPEVDYDGRLSTREASVGGMLSGDFSASVASRLSFSLLFNHLTEDNARVLEGFNLDSNTDQRNTRIQYVESSLLQGRVGGKHYLDFLFQGSTLEWRGAWARSGRYEPNTREVLYRQAEDGRFLFDTFIQSGSVFHQDLDERALNGGLDLRIPIEVSGVPGSVSIGGAATRRDRDVLTRRFRFLPAGGPGALGDARALEPDQLFSPRFIAPDSLVIQEVTFRPDNYDADQTILAGYAMADFEIVPRLRFAGGVRVEKATQNVHPRDLFESPAEPSRGADLEDTDVVPGANLTLAVTDAMNLRAAGSWTIARPEFRELAPFSFANFAGGYLVAGNPELARSRILNLDLRWEWFPRPGAVVSVSGFYKRFDDPIEEIVFPSSEFIQSWVNAESARNFGTEVEARSDLGFLSDGLENLALNLNLTLVDSEVDTGSEALIFVPGSGPFTIQVVDKDRRLQGQSPYVVNAGLNWTIPGSGTALTLLYNRFGSRIDAVGTQFLDDVFEEPRDALDVAVEQRIGERVGVRVSGKNLLGSEHRFIQAGDLLRGWDTGRSVSLKLSWQPVGVAR